MRAFKNRFGAVNEIGVFAMTEKGLREVHQSVGAVPVAARIRRGGLVRDGDAGRHAAAAGRDAGAGRRGARRQLRSGSRVGLEQNRLAMLLAVLHRHAGIACFDQDVFVNAVGGVRIAEPAADLAVTLAIVSSLRNRPLPEKHVVFGEVGLAGEVRPVQRGQERLREAAKLGFTHAIIPAANKPQAGRSRASQMVAVDRLVEAVDYLEVSASLTVARLLHQRGRRASADGGDRRAPRSRRWRSGSWRSWPR